ncbi:helix-turn-helix transcriptional regulator [Tissierella sp. MB52-C2]|uniref:helix-turn-helix domain-containing protein n=1 Tax=Tissierella sp. MB52-C2 TaxID=3070999 RepID=UPI00280B1E9D|nr:helix-turn-helix transcriptional regulator [Tissierella sp. MB52-C2]WMM24091.1 helix-turn-helix transcriptional regulator [Tissierella sp. MB52-C2]
MNKFSDRLRYLRASHGLTQEKLSKDIEEVFGYPIAKATISQYENGNREPSISMLINLAQYFNCSIDYLVGISDHISIIDSSEFMNKMLLLKTIVDILPKMDYVQSHNLNKLISEYLGSNDLK